MMFRLEHSVVLCGASMGKVTVDLFRGMGL
jgi:hypothetical protein